MKTVEPSEYQANRGARCGVVVESSDLPVTLAEIKRFANSRKARFVNAGAAFYVVSDKIGGSSQDLGAYTNHNLFEQVEEWNRSVDDSTDEDDSSGSIAA